MSPKYERRQPRSKDGRLEQTDVDSARRCSQKTHSSFRYETTVINAPNRVCAPYALRWMDLRLVFTCSWSDWFHPAADAWRPEAWAIVRATPHLTYQILTKRPELITERLPPDWGQGYENVWLGVSVENSRFTWRAETLAEIPAVTRFVSAEPLLGSLFIAGRRKRPLELRAIDWVIVGGESGPDARAMDVAWAREIAEACRATGTAFFMKQLGSVVAREAGARDRKGGDWAAFPPDLRRREMPVAA